MIRTCLFVLVSTLMFVTSIGAEVRTLHDIEFAKPNGHSLTLDLYLPTDSHAPTPVVIFVHGGGWKNGSKASAKKTASWLAEHGFAIVAIDYRLTDKAQWPAQLNDCRRAVAWCRQNAKTYNFDQHNIGAWGTSAGAHLAALMGTSPFVEGADFTKESAAIKAVCDWFGPSDLLTMPPNNIGNGRTAEDIANSNGAKLLGCTVRENVELAKSASAYFQASVCDASFLIMHGDKDTGVPLSQSQKLHNRLCEAQVPSELVVIKGAGHGGKLFQTEAARRKVLAFFQRTLLPVWPLGGGPHANFAARGAKPPTSWSVVRKQGIQWVKTLPETGQSTITVWRDRIFFTTMQEVKADSELGKNIVAWCCDAATGETIWKRDIPAEHPLRLSGCFSDSSAPPPVTDGDRVVFFNASGAIACFDFAGKQLWSRELMAVGRSQPFLLENAVVFIKQTYMPDEHGHFTHEFKDAPVEDWTQLYAIDIADGKDLWKSTCGANMGCVPVPHNLKDGRRGILVGRGGGHSPPEKPEGVSLVDAANGDTIWSLELPGFMSTMTLNVSGGNALIFHDDQHLQVDIETGKITSQSSFLNDVSVCAYSEGEWEMRTETLPPPRKKRAIIQQSNVLAGDFHYFRSYSRPYVGRINCTTGKAEYLQLPIQLKRTTNNETDELLWNASQMPTKLVNELKKSKNKPAKSLPIEQWCFAPNDMKNSRGLIVMGDARSRGSGWGHHASPIPTIVGDRLIIPTMNGTVYVLNANAKKWNQSAIIGVNDLGPVGKSFNRASISFAGGRLYAHTIREAICVTGAAKQGED